jgi:glycosyltransferase involved in cell wall biosynthesis
MPDALAFAALPVRLAGGVPIVLDLHEAMPELFRVRFPRASGRLAHGLLRAQERASIALAAAVLTVNDALAARLVGLGARPDKVSVVRNGPSVALFDPAAHPARPFMADGRLRVIYAGALSPVYELDVTLEAVARIAQRRPELDVAYELYGRDYGEVDLVGGARRLGIEERVSLPGRIPLEAVPAALARADIGLAPTRRSPFTDFSLSSKLYECAAMGKPVVASRLPMVERAFPLDTAMTYEPGDPADLAAAILRLVDDPADRDARVARTRSLVDAASWEREAPRYVSLIERHAIDGQRA